VWVKLQSSRRFPKSRDVLTRKSPNPATLPILTHRAHDPCNQGVIVLKSPIQDIGVTLSGTAHRDEIDY